jgi:hypothetical protein
MANLTQLLAEVIFWGGMSRVRGPKKLRLTRMDPWWSALPIQVKKLYAKSLTHYSEPTPRTLCTALDRQAGARIIRTLFFPDHDHHVSAKWLLVGQQETR